MIMLMITSMGLARETQGIMDSLLTMPTRLFDVLIAKFTAYSVMAVGRCKLV